MEGIVVWPKYVSQFTDLQADNNRWYVIGIMGVATEDLICIIWLKVFLGLL